MRQHLTMTVTQRGRFRQGAILQQAITPALAVPINGATAQLLTAFRAGTPVRTGRLQRGWFSLPAWWQGSGRQLQFASALGNSVYYMQFVEQRGKSAGFVERAIRRATKTARQYLNTGMIRLSPMLWGRDNR